MTCILGRQILDHICVTLIYDQLFSPKALPPQQSQTSHTAQVQIFKSERLICPIHVTPYL